MRPSRNAGNNKDRGGNKATSIGTASSLVGAVMLSLGIALNTDEAKQTATAEISLQAISLAPPPLMKRTSLDEEVGRVLDALDDAYEEQKLDLSYVIKLSAIASEAGVVPYRRLLTEGKFGPAFQGWKITPTVDDGLVVEKILPERAVESSTEEESDSTFENSEEQPAAKLQTEPLSIEKPEERASENSKTKKEPQKLQTKGLSDEEIKRLIVSLLEENGPMSTREIKNSFILIGEKRLRKYLKELEGKTDGRVVWSGTERTDPLGKWRRAGIEDDQSRDTLVSRVFDMIKDKDSMTVGEISEAFETEIPTPEAARNVIRNLKHNKKIRQVGGASSDPHAAWEAVEHSDNEE